MFGAAGLAMVASTLRQHYISAEALDLRRSSHPAPLSPLFYRLPPPQITRGSAQVRNNVLCWAAFVTQAYSAEFQLPHNPPKKWGRLQVGDPNRRSLLVLCVTAAARASIDLRAAKKLICIRPCPVLGGCPLLRLAFKGTAGAHVKQISSRP